jgi:hypothetical protein
MAPLTPTVFHVLLALFGRERNIMRQVKSDSQGVVKDGPGTLSGSLDRMMKLDLRRKATRKSRAEFTAS